MKTPRPRPSLYVFCPSYALQGPAERERSLKTARAWARRMSWRMSPSPLLFIEDIDERAHHIDFALNQLWLSGALDGVRALVGGTFPAPQSPDYQGPDTRDVLRSWGRKLDIPVLARLPFGHQADALFLPVGRQTDLSAREDGTWTVRFRARGNPQGGLRPQSKCVRL